MISMIYNCFAPFVAAVVNQKSRSCKKIQNKAAMIVANSPYDACCSVNSESWLVNYQYSCKKRDRHANLHISEFASPRLLEKITQVRSPKLELYEL